MAFEFYDVSVMKASNSGVNLFDFINHMKIHDILQEKELNITCLNLNLNV